VSLERGAMFPPTARLVKHLRRMSGATAGKTVGSIAGWTCHLEFTSNQRNPRMAQITQSDVCVCESRRQLRNVLLGLLFAMMSIPIMAQPLVETPQERDARMAWWREARFGMFIHWGLYSIPAGEWNGQTSHAEWIRTTAQIPAAKYDEFV
jgi:hypothetical protein